METCVHTAVMSKKIIHTDIKSMMGTKFRSTVVPRPSPSSPMCAILVLHLIPVRTNEIHKGHAALLHIDNRAADADLKKSVSHHGDNRDQKSEGRVIQGFRNTL